MAKTPSANRPFRVRENPYTQQKFVIAAIISGAVAILALTGYYLWLDLQPTPILGDLAELASPEHILPGGKAINFTTDPPTSGNHDGQPATAGFYDAAPSDEQLVHNLEHGYVVIYYDCSPLSNAECDDFKDDMQKAMDGAGVTSNTRTPKLIVVPRPEMGNLLTFTSWGRIFRVDAFDHDEFVLFVRQNRNQAPEPRAP